MMDKHILQFLNNKENYTVLSREKINKGELFSKDLDKKFSREILLSDDVSDNSYEYLVKSNHWMYGDLDVSGLPESRIVTLLNNDKLKFTVSNFEYLVESNTDKYIDLIELDFDKFFETKDELDLPDGTTTKLLLSDILQPEDKEKIVKEIQEEGEQEEPDYDLLENEDGLVRGIIDFCLKEEIELNFDFIEVLFKHENEISKKIQLLIKHAEKFENYQIYSLLMNLGDPYSDIVYEDDSQNYAYLPISNMNHRLADALKASGYIKSHWDMLYRIKLHLIK